MSYCFSYARSLIAGLVVTIMAQWTVSAQQPQIAEPSTPPSTALTELDSSSEKEDLFQAFAAYKAQYSPDNTTSWIAPTTETIAAKAQAALILQQKLIAYRTKYPLEGQDLTSFEIIEHILRKDLNDFVFDTIRIPFTGDYGFHLVPIMAAHSERVRSPEDAERWIEKLESVPDYLEAYTTHMRRGLNSGFMAHADPINGTIKQLETQSDIDFSESDLFLPFHSLPESIRGLERSRILEKGRRSVSKAVRSYTKLHTFFKEEYRPKAREKTGIESLENGNELYAALTAHHTTDPNLSPAEIHEIGKAEVARIRDDMNNILIELDFRGSLQDFISILRTDPQFYARSEIELMGYAALLSKRLDALLPQYFETLPRLTYGVVPVPASYAANYTTGRYHMGDPKKGKAGQFLVNTHRLDQRPLYELPALAAHEAVPGHHLQIALAQEIGDVYPEFRKRFYANAFGEGWALYAEKLVGEAGFYQTPYERFGQLSYEMWRACRLVVDTGIHLYNWSREQARQCFLENTALSPHNIETEITRYIGWPGQAVAYKIGELKILELRAKAETKLGDDFDIRKFHDFVLKQGSVPLPSLERLVNAWINETKPDDIDDVTAADIPTE